MGLFNRQVAITTAQEWVRFFLRARRQLVDDLSGEEDDLR